MTDYREIPLTQGAVARVSPEDFEVLSRYSWQTLKPNDRSKTVYAKALIKRGGRYRTVLMHRLIMGEPKGLTVDHRDGNGLNNVRSNLSLCTLAENARRYHRKANKERMKEAILPPKDSPGFRAAVVQRRLFQAGITMTEAARELGYDTRGRQEHVRSVLRGATVSNPVLQRLEEYLERQAQTEEATA